MFTSQVYDSNLEHDKADPIRSNGFVAGGDVRYQTAEIRPGFTADYEIARHAYSRSDQFDRVSQDLTVLLSRRLTRQLTAEAIGEAALKGSSEDRDVGDQYIILPRLSLKFGARRLRAYGAYRLRRYDTDTDRNANNRYVGTELRSAVGGTALLEGGYRYETNSARGARRSYTRRTYYADFSRTLGPNDGIYADLRYRSQRYDKRIITNSDGVREPRNDHRISPTIEWTHRFGSGFSLLTAYNFENRSSNDPKNGYVDHVFSLTWRYDW